MRKILSFIIALLLLASAFPGFAEETVENTEGDGSKFEQVMLKKGTLIVKEFTECGYFEKDEYILESPSSELFAFTDTLKFQVATLLDVETGAKVYALRITTGYWRSQYDYGEAIGVMDADEIDGAIHTLQYIKQHINELKDYSEIVYNASSGMTIGAYCSSSGNKLFVKVNSKATKFYEVDTIDSLISLFEEAQEKLEN